MKYTINQFRKEFSNDDVCLDAIFKLRYTKMPCCPRCYQQTTFKRIQTRRAYQCSDKDCQYQLYPTAGTVFEKTRTPLKDWFYVIYLMASTRNGVASKEVERQLGVTYKCAFRMTHQIRKLMAVSDDLLTGIIEIDETYIGGLDANKHISKLKKQNMGRGIAKTPVITLVQRNGAVKSFVTENVSSATIYDIINNNIAKGSKMITDGFTSYNWIGRQYEHISIKHNLTKEHKYVTHGDRHTNTVEGFFSHLKRMIKGTHLHVSPKHLQQYANEASFKYTHRKQGQLIFYTILNKCA